MFQSSVSHAGFTCEQIQGGLNHDRSFQKDSSWLHGEPPKGWENDSGLSDCKEEMPPGMYLPV